MLNIGYGAVNMIGSTVDRSVPNIDIVWLLLVCPLVDKPPISTQYTSDLVLTVGV